MVKIYLGILGLLLSFSGFAQQINYNDGWGDPGLTITTQTGESVALNYTIDEFTIGDKRINEEFMKEIYLGTYFSLITKVLPTSRVWEGISQSPAGLR